MHYIQQLRLLLILTFIQLIFPHVLVVQLSFKYTH